MSESLERLRTMTTEELVTKHDQLASHTAVGTAHYLAEISRRDDHAKTDAVLRLTRWITIMTLVVTAATIANVVLVALSVMR